MRQIIITLLDSKFPVWRGIIIRMVSDFAGQVEKRWLPHDHALDFDQLVVLAVIVCSDFQEMGEFSL